MNILFCKIPFMKKYCGCEDFINNNDNSIISKFYQEKKGNNPEKYIFQDYNGSCYGYISVKDGVVNLNEIEFKNSEELLFKDITVIFLYFNEKTSKNIILGWYKSSNIYKYLQRKISYPSIGRDLYFNIVCKAKNSFLLPEERRDFCIDVPFKEGTNIFLATQDNKDLISKSLTYINNYSGNFINVVFDESSVNEVLKDAVNNPISLSKRGYIYLYNEGNYYEALKFFNTALLYKDKLNKDQLVDIEYCKGLCLQFLNAFYFAKIQFEKVVELNFGNYQIYKNLIYLYLISKDYKKALNLCDKVLNEETKENPSLLTEINCIKIDILIEMNEINKVKNLLKNIVNTTEDLLLKSHCEKMLNKLNLIN